MNFRLPRLFKLPARPRHPDPQIRARTGDARYVPTMATWRPGKNGTVVQQANRLDDVTIFDLDRARFYPIAKDSINTLMKPLLRADYTFKCDRQDIADHTMELFGPLVRQLCRALAKPAKEFGWSVVQPRWIPKFDVTVKAGQSSAGTGTEKFYPFVWAVKSFYKFSPKDTRVLIDTRTGDFAGVRQLVTSRHPNGRDILAKDCIHYVNDGEFDGNYGVSALKAAVPFIEAAEKHWDSMVLSGDKYADPIKTMRYPYGKTPMGLDSQNKPVYANNADIADGMGDAAAGGSTISLPSDVWPNTDVPRWDIKFELPPSGSDRYVPELQILNDMVRISIGVPEVASSSMPDTGTYNMGTSIIQLLMDNIQAELDQIEDAVNNQFLPWWVLYNFGADAPPCYLRFQPVDFDTARMILQAFLPSVAAGEPIDKTEDGVIVIDRAKMLEDIGVATKLVKRSEADGIADAIADRLRGLAGGKSEEETKK